MSHYPKSLSHLSAVCFALALGACTGAIQDHTAEPGAQDPAVVTAAPGDTAQLDTEPSSDNSRPEEQINGPSTQSPSQDPTQEVVESAAEDRIEGSTDDERGPVSEPIEGVEQESLGDPDEQSVSLLEPPVIETLNRPRRRMNLDQLNLAIREVTGGQYWTEVVNNQERDLFVTLSDTLGKPDYIQSTTEDLTPSALFLKFLDDAARQVCDKRISLDLQAMDDPRAEPAPDSVKLWGGLSLDASMRGDSEAIEAQIRALVLRFHSHQLPEGDSARLAYWRWLFETASLVDGQPLSGWRALCVALINHPDFYSY